jgi:hypothetical protein
MVITGTTGLPCIAVPGFRICAHDDCKSLGELSDGEEEPNEDDSDANKGTK